MTDTAFTPGPWAWYDGCSWRRLATVASNGCDTVVCPTKHLIDGHPDTIVTDADAHLIAAAPDLYAALDRICSTLQNMPAEAHTALAKARGEQVPA